MTLGNRHTSQLLKFRIIWQWWMLTLAILISTRPAFAGTSTVTNPNDSGSGSFRQAILDANVAPTPSVINFNIPPGGAQTIALLSPLPDITNSVTLDATTQSGFSGPPLIELNGSSAGSSANGLSLLNGGQVRGFVINRFASYGIYAFGAGPNVTIFEGNYIGTDTTGTMPRSNGLAGIYTFGPGSRIGGTNAAARNVISGNGTHGVVFLGLGHRVLGNFIGVGASGSNPLGNGQSGVFFFAGGTQHSVGDGTAAGANVIAYNGASGVALRGVQCLIEGNSLYANAGLGIDLGTDGITLNDVGDGDAGPNGLQNFPVLTAATLSSSNLMVVGALNSGTNKIYRLDFYSNPACHTSGYGEGKRHLGFTNVMTDGNANASFRAVFPPLGGELYMTATATDSNGNTSEFSLCRQATQAGTNTVTNLNSSGPGSLAQAIADSNNGETINFSVTGTIPGGFVIDKNLTIIGPGASKLSISGGFTVQVFAINAGATGSISGLTIRDGYSPSGGGIYNDGTLMLTACTISGNSATDGGGGGIYNAGILTLAACTITGNSITGGSSAGGGGVANVGSLTLTLCTICDNSVGDATTFFTFGGGGVYNSGGTLTLRSCTISGNSTTASFHGDGAGISGSCTLRNTLVAGNIFHFDRNKADNDISGSVTSQGHNLLGVSDGSTGITNGVNGDLAGTGANPLAAKLGGLADYRGPTPTLSLVPGSPAIDAGDDALLNAPFNLTTDQRGSPRKAGAHVDIGAFELLTGDLNNDGVVDLNELNAVLGNYNNGAVNQSALDSVLARYWPASPWLSMTNTAGLGGTNVHFALPNSTGWNFSVEFSTNLMDWQFLGPAYPAYEFLDHAAPNSPQRYYRLRYP
jgi:hypothetical protein